MKRLQNKTVVRALNATGKWSARLRVINDLECVEASWKGIHDFDGSGPRFFLRPDGGLAEVSMRHCEESHVHINLYSYVDTIEEVKKFTREASLAYRLSRLSFDHIDAYEYAPVAERKAAHGCTDMTCSECDY